MNSTRSLLVRFFAAIFNVVKIPPSFEELAANPQNYVLVTQSGSSLIEGLLFSFARRCGLEGTHRMGFPATRLWAGDGTQLLRWAQLDDSEVLNQIYEQESKTKYCTLNIFPLRGPIRHSPSSRRGPMWLASLVLARRLLIVLVGAPLELPSVRPGRLERCLRIDFHNNLRLVRGAPFQSLPIQEAAILSGAEFTREISLLAERSGLSEGVARIQAREAFYEMAANPIRFMYSLVSLCARRILGRLFRDISSAGLDRLRGPIRENTVVLVPMHRSHLDYVILGYDLYTSNINPPLVAAGMNLAFWPVGIVLRSVGAYFVKRNARDRFHTLLLRRYVSYLVKRGHLQEFFIEGGRSRSGKMLQPKVGLLSVLAESFFRGLKRDLIFVPVAITYENVIEDGDFARENRGESKTKESFVSFLRALDVFRRGYGDVMIQYGEPLSLARFQAEWNNERGARTKGSEGRKPRPGALDRAMVQELGNSLCRSIAALTNPTLMSVACTALMCSDSYSLPQLQLVDAIQVLARYLDALRAVEPTMGPDSPSLRAFMSGRHEVLSEILSGGVVEKTSLLEEPVYSIPPDKRLQGDFYRSFLIGCFFPLGFAAACGSDEGESRFLHQVLAYEYLLPDLERFLARQRGVTELCRSKGWIKEDIPALPFDLSFLLLASLQSATWVEFNLEHRRADSAGGDRCFQYAPFLGALQREFDHSSLVLPLNRTESSSKANLVACLESLSSRQFLALQERAGERALILVRQSCGDELARLIKICRRLSKRPH